MKDVKIRVLEDLYGDFRDIYEVTVTVNGKTAELRRFYKDLGFEQVAEYVNKILG